jgi:hypothetical protein
MKELSGGCISNVVHGGTDGFLLFFVLVFFFGAEFFCLRVGMYFTNTYAPKKQTKPNRGVFIMI